MKNMYGAAAAVAAVMVATSGQAQDGGMGFSINPYIEGGIGASRTSYESGGFNTVGPFFNVPETEVDTGVSVKMAIGLSDIVSFGPVGLRIEGEVKTFDGANFITGSFPGAPNPTFFYATQVDRSYTAMANVWADFSPLESMPITLSVGGGVGAAWLSGSTNDTVVTAAASDTTFSWNVGAQAAYAFDENFSAGVEARYYDLGTLDMPINGGPGGNYTLDFSSLYAGAFLRLNFGDIGG